MIYLDEGLLKRFETNWNENINVIENTVNLLHTGDFAQPLKPYLKFQDPQNRFIAMPAYVGGEHSVAGIKWIGSFPKNTQIGLRRAQSITVLNHSETGVPLSIINTSLISVLRTAAVSGLMVKYYEKFAGVSKRTLGVIGFGPIGQMHVEMITKLLGDRLSKILLYDVAGIQKENLPYEIRDITVICNNWQEVYDESDIFITATVSAEGYIDRAPKKKALLLNVSLRDFKPEILKYTKSIVVDDWDEVCRANTDIDVMHTNGRLEKKDTKSIIDVVCGNALDDLSREDAVMFNPMGMAVFDIAIAHHYYLKATEQGIGITL
ncbi:2,3-diaminopropionate biosynthesis protein SbnB [Paenibacillus taichungensis]|uniref:2,3-diaminopropionate biosynthesis protein SbnB n=1 Tax=Paenibacillus taichungensis TaxID=484184 RepID=UPI0038D21633